MSFGEGSELGGRYRLQSQVGRGGMGRVWLARDELLHRDVAIKEVIFPPGLTASDRELLYERTLREARSAARLSHPGIVTVHDVIEEDGRPWIVMEYVRARSLQEIIDHEGPLPAARVAEIGVQMLAALRTAHTSGVLHRDVKPANVLLDTGSSGEQDAGAVRVVITDFGIARVEGDATLTLTGTVLGSPAYIAPERARGEGAGPASDLWALGATLYAACEGRAPHHRVEAMAALNAVLHEEPAPPANAGPLAPVLMALLNKDPAERMMAGRAAEELARIARGAPPPPPRGDVTQTLREPPGEPPPHPSGLYAPPPPSGPYSPTQPSGPYPPPSPQRTGRVLPKILLIGGIIALVVAVSAATLVMNNRSGHHKPSPTPAPTTPTAPPPTTPGPPTQTPSPKPTVPAGFTRSSGTDGAKLAVPAGWRRRVLGPASVQWSGPGGAYVQVDAIPWRTNDPVKHWERFESEAVAKGNLPGYQRLDLSTLMHLRGWPAADLRYVWTTSSRGTMTAYDRGFTANGHQYAILVAAPEGQFDRYSGLLDKVFNAFEPAP